MNKYAIAIFYSDGDEGFMAVVPELPNYCPSAYLDIFTRKQK
jgi:predicted RNase H-like HicB family nuclease